ncbi:MAG: hypothetical protein JZU47_21980 [Prolixibacteraceae bacterium]|nr:hypothetical protein [Prolixibacteraceae bacterium]
MRLIITIFLLQLLLVPISGFSQDFKGKSIYTQKIIDPKAVYFTKANFKVSADGVGDDAPALQAAIDQVLNQSQGGIIFIPEGIYRLGNTIRLWSGIRLIGYGAKRPTFKLGDNSPGFQEGEHKYMVHFCQSKGASRDPQPGVWQTPEFMDGTWVTFFSGISNINFEIGVGNPAAIAVRYHVSQVCVLENIDFNIGNGLGGIEEMGNIIENCTFRGGSWGIKTNASPPDWQCMVLDCTFEQQREACLISNGARMLVIRNRFKNAPVGILVPDREKLFVKDSWFEDISATGMHINNFVPPDLQVNLENVKFSKVPYSVRFNGRTQGWRKEDVKMDYPAPASVFLIKSFSHGLHIEMPLGEKNSAKFETKMEQSPIESLGEFEPKDVSELPAQTGWVNIAELGAKGDGSTDCTDIFEKAIAKHNTIYVPIGKYVISKTLNLKEQTTLIGFQPSMTQLILKDGTPGFTDPEIKKPLLVTPKNGTNGITGIGFNFGNNPGVIGIKWMAGINSYINDGLFNGGNDKALFGKGQACTIWITDGGGGVFKNFWINDRRSGMPFLVSDTKTPGNIYEISIEHHKDLEVKLDNIENWSFYALQLEEDRGCEQTLGVYLKDCRNILFTNFISHRTTGVWEPYFTCFQIRNSHEIYLLCNDIRGAVFPFENTVFDEITGNRVPYRTFSKLTIK